MSHQTNPRPIRTERVRIAIFCALPVESEAIERIACPCTQSASTPIAGASNDTNVYTTVRVGDEDVVIVHLSGPGSIPSSSAAANIRKTFQNIELAVVAGVCGGVPYPQHHKKPVFLGDVLVGTSLVLHDSGRHVHSGVESKTNIEDMFGRLPPKLRSFISILQGEEQHRSLEESLRSMNPPSSPFVGPPDASIDPTLDYLYGRDYIHKHRISKYATPCSTCSASPISVCSTAIETPCEALGCDKTRRKSRFVRHRALQGTVAPDYNPAVHFGRLGCGNTVMRSGQHRDNVASKHDLIGFEMEGAGVWDEIPCLVIKSVCDYADSHKNKLWQRYSAMIAARATVAVLRLWIQQFPPRTPSQRWDFYKKLETATDGITLSATDPPSHPVTVRGANVHWMVDQPLNAHFSGRNTEVGKVKDVFLAHIQSEMASNSCRVVITGVPGQGKSELCLRIVNELRSHYWGVFWVDVESRMRASEDYLRISRLLGHPVEDFRAARQQLSVEDRPWLLILDNADDHDYDYQQYIPSGWHGCILITSRNPSFSSLSTQLTINLESLSDEEARSLLVRAAGHIDLGCMWDEQEIGEVCKVLSNHPLALIQAGAYIDSQCCTVKDYLELFSLQRRSVLSYHSPQAVSRFGSVAATFETAVKTLDDTTNRDAFHARLLLSTLCTMGCGPIPMLAFKHAWQSARRILHKDPRAKDFRDLCDWHTVQHPLSHGSLDENPQWSQMACATQRLRGLSLIQRTTVKSAPAIVMHPLVHTWARGKQDEKDRADAWIHTCCFLALLSTNLDHGDSDVQSWLQPLVVNFLDTVNPLWLRVPEQHLIFRAMYQLAMLLVAWDNFDYVGHIVNTVFVSLDRQPTEVSLDTLHFHDIFVSMKKREKRFVTALNVQRQIVDVVRSHDPINNSLLIHHLHNLGTLCNRLNMSKDGRDARSQILGIYTQGQSNPVISDTRDLWSAQQLARAIRWAGLADASISLHRHLFRVSAQLKGLCHIKTLQCEAELAKCYAQHGLHKKALINIEDAANQVHGLLPGSHKITRQMWYQLAEVYVLSGYRDRAINVLRNLISLADECADPRKVQKHETLLSKICKATVGKDSVRSSNIYQHTPFFPMGTMDSGRSFGPDDFVGATFIHQDEDSVADHELCERLNILLESHDEPQCSVFGSNPPTNVSSMAAWSHNTGSSGDGLGRSTRSAFSSHSIYRPVSGKTAQHLSYLRGNTNPSTRSQRREYTYQPTPSKRGTVRYETPRRENTGLAQSLHIDTKESSLENQRGIPILPPKTLDAASKLIPPWNVPEPPCNESLDRVIRTSDESQPCRPAEPRLERIPRSWNRSPSPFRPGEFPESRRPTRTSLSEDLARFEQYMRSAKREVAAPREHSSNHDSIIGNLRTMQLRPTDNHSDILSAQDGPVPAVATIIKIASTGLQDGEVEHVESLP